MVLEWINPKNRQLHVNENLQEYSDQTAINAAPSAYADDLATCSAGPQTEYIQIKCPINPTLTTYKYLGVYLDLRCKNTDAFDRQNKKQQPCCLIS
jgi:hypothetical protein